MNTPVSIVVEGRTEDGWIVHPEGQPGIWEFGSTIAEATGKLVVSLEMVSYTYTDSAKMELKDQGFEVRK